jgi:hypothetical protein
MPPSTSEAPRDGMLRVRLPSSLLAEVERAAESHNQQLAEYVRTLLASAVDDRAWTKAPPYNGPYWVAMPGALGPLFAVVTGHTGRTCKVSFPYLSDLREPRPFEKVPRRERTLWYGPLRWPDSTPHL